MPTDSNYEYVDTAHDKTKIDSSYRYGCNNRVSVTNTIIVQDGWKNAWVTDSNMRESQIQVPNFVEIPISFKNDGCHHTERLADPYCEGCRDRGGKVNV